MLLIFRFDSKTCLKTTDVPEISSRARALIVIRHHQHHLTTPHRPHDTNKEQNLNKTYQHEHTSHSDSGLKHKDLHCLIHC